VLRQPSSDQVTKQLPSVGASFLSSAYHPPGLDELMRNKGGWATSICVHIVVENIAERRMKSPDGLGIKRLRNYKLNQLGNHGPQNHPPSLKDLWADNAFLEKKALTPTPVGADKETRHSKPNASLRQQRNKKAGLREKGGVNQKKKKKQNRGTNS